MTKSTITRERLEALANAEYCKSNPGAWLLGLKELNELARMALAAMDSEPVVKKVACWSCQNEVEIAAISDCDGCCPKCGTRIHLDEEPYIAPLSAPDRDQVRQEHAEWSQSTFGNVGPVGPLKHLSKEALEAAADPGDLSEWADMQFLLWDAQRRAGITDEQITQAMIDKLAVNKQREWPEPKDGEPRLHIKEQPVPVVPKSMSVRQAISALESAGAVTTIGQAYKMGWNACRAAMLQELKKVQELKRSAGVTKMCRYCTPNLRRNPIAARRKTSSLQRKAQSITVIYQSANAQGVRLLPESAQKWPSTLW